MQQLVVPRSIKNAHIKIENLYAGEKGLNLLRELISKIQPEEKICK